MMTTYVATSVLSKRLAPLAWLTSLLLKMRASGHCSVQACLCELLIFGIVPVDPAVNEGQAGPSLLDSTPMVTWAVCLPRV